MILSIPCLQTFIEPVPRCLATAHLTTALAALGQADSSSGLTTAPSRLVLVDEQQYPIGWVSAQMLLHCLATAGLLGQWSGDGDRPLVADLPVLDVMPSIVEPLIVIEAALAISAFLPRLHRQPHACYALVDTDGNFLGVLDSPRLLQFLATRAARPPDDHPLVSSAGAAPTIATPAPPCHPLLSPLLRELLEHLPLPVMLQTRDGQVLAQNSIWRTQISELLDPSWLRHEVATLLEMPLAETAVPQPNHQVWSPLEPPFMGEHLASVRSHPFTLEARTSTPDAYYLDDNGISVPAPLPSASSCQLGTKPGTCICVCPLKDGQEQVLQFVRIPLGALSAQTALNLGDRVQTLVAAGEAPFSEAPFSQDPTAPSQLFRLAALLSNVHDATGTVQSPGSSHPTAIVPASEELWLVLAQDVTEQQQLARELTAKNADLIQLNRLKDEFLACISHELRTPLTAVLGLSSLLKDQTLGTLNQRQVYYAQLIHQSGRHLMAVVNDILDLTRMETGQLELELAPVNLETVCRRAFEQAQQLRVQESSQTVAASDTAIGADADAELPTFSLALDPNLGLLIADEQRLRQMLVHLLSNALKFTESHDPIGLKVSRWGGWIALTVWDTGIGIPAEKQHLIFQKFQQLENPLTRRFEGTGLGLVLTRRLARLHGGDVTFVSKEGEGSQFTILLPPQPPGTNNSSHTFMAASKTVDAAHDIGRSPPQGMAPIVQGLTPDSAGKYALDCSAVHRSQLVMIVEASPQCIEALSDQLTGLGYRVVIARSGTEALEKARRLQPCIIFLNPVLPLLSGWDVLTLLKSNVETQQLPVVIMATKVDEEQARQRQSDQLLSLPIQPQVLQKCLQTLVIDRQAKPQLDPIAPLTILRLSPGVWSNPYQPIPTAELNALLHAYHCRVLESDDLEQAELLARVWKPNVVLLDGVLADAMAYFQQYSRQIYLASLPLVTIDQATSQAANQVQGLLVFPCLSTPEAQLTANQDVETSALLQVIQVAAGYAWRPSILALDAATLPMALAVPNPQDTSEREWSSFPQETDWLQALTQYLDTAGLRGVVGRCWQEVQQQLESQSVDVLIICWTDTIAPPFTIPMLSALQQLRKRPPILVLDHRSQRKTTDSMPIVPLPDVLKQIATQTLPASLSMTELLKQIHQVMQPSKRQDGFV